MKKNRALLILLVATGLSLSAGQGLAQLRPRATNAFMRLKLDYANGVLEGVTLGKYDMVVTNAIPLRNMSMTNTFLLLGNPNYGHAITNFQATVDRLINAAKEKDQAKTIEDYTAMVRSCVQCHEQFRRDRVLPAGK